MIYAFFQWLRRREIAVLLASFVAIGGVWAFIALADEVKERDTQRFDERIILALRRPGNLAVPIGPPWLHEMGRDMTALGGVAVLSLMTFAVLGFLWMRGKTHALVYVLASTLGGLALSSLLKWLIRRDRPSLVPHLSIVSSSSFPSGHSMMSAIVYLTLGSLLARFVAEWRLKIYFITLAMLLTGLVGVSRVYMGVHYPTDVLAGWTAGLGWASICWLGARYLQHQGAFEPADGMHEETPRPDTCSEATKVS